MSGSSAFLAFCRALRHHASSSLSQSSKSFHASERSSWLRYRDTYHLEPKNQKQGFCKNFTAEAVKKYGLKDYQSMTKEELIRELAMSKINEARAKKGYQVEGDGANKRFIPLNSKNTK